VNNPFAKENEYNCAWESYAIFTIIVARIKYSCVLGVKKVRHSVLCKHFRGADLLGFRMVSTCCKELGSGMLKLAAGRRACDVVVDN